MSSAHSFLTDPRDPTTSQPATRAPDAKVAGSSRLDGLLQVVSPANVGVTHPTRQSGPQDWTALIDRVQSAAKRTREVEAQAHEQELHVRQILDEVRSDIAEADERVRVAEARVRDVQARAATQIRAADARAEAAEERARSAEAWLARIGEAIAAEFADVPRQATL